MARKKNPEGTRALILEAAQRLFLEKGYENTSIQDIINELGGLSKGAIYHHFRSKEDIFNAVGDRFNEKILQELVNVRDASDLSGGEKLKRMFEISLSGPDRDILMHVAPDLMENPRLLVFQIQEIFDVVAPHFVQPLLEEGLRDGSIHTDYPKELAEVISLLANLWLNPLLVRADAKEQANRVRFFADLLKSMGLDLLDDAMLERYLRFYALGRPDHG